MVMDREYHRDYSRRYYHERREEYVRLLGGKCSLCPATSGLEFDHLVRSEKAFSIGKLLNYSKARALEELKKCRLLCSPCHARRSRLQASVNWRLIARIRRANATGNFTQTELAKRFGVSQPTVSKYLRKQ